MSSLHCPICSLEFVYPVKELILLPGTPPIPTTQCLSFTFDIWLSSARTRCILWSLLNTSWAVLCHVSFILDLLSSINAINYTNKPKFAAFVTWQLSRSSYYAIQGYWLDIRTKINDCVSSTIVYESVRENKELYWQGRLISLVNEYMNSSYHPLM